MAEQKTKVLILDDDPDFLKLIQTMLTKNGCSVEISQDYEDALKKAYKQPDVILIDMMMPRINGLQFMQILAEDPETSKISVIIMSARGEAYLMDLADRLGAKAYLVKPIDFKKLLGLIKSRS